MLQVRQIECIRGDRRLFHGLSFQLEARQALRVRGENGSGKTSLLRMVAGLSPVETGQILWNDGPIAALGEDYRRHLVFLGHANGLKDDLTPIENLRYALALAGVHASDPVLRAALNGQGLAGSADLPARLLSQGQKRRVALCRLGFCTDIPLWVLDEPFAALDAASVERVSAVVVGHLRGGGMAVFTTHQEVDLAGVRVISLELGVQ